MRNNYHTHTSRCGHAKGTDKEYVENAIKMGIKVLGFSDHIMLPGLEQKGIRGNYELLDDYLSSIENLKKEFKGKIKILKGFEAEYFDEYEDYYRDLLKSKKIQYLILGQHFYFVNKKELKSCLFLTNDKDVHDIYLKQLLKGMASGIYSYVAHPDAFVTLSDKVEDYFDDMFKQICEASIKYDIPLEINLCQKRRTPNPNIPQYPYEPFWKMVSEYGCRVVVGVDAHHPEDLVKGPYEVADYLIEKYKLKVENKIQLKKW